jgi:TRAP-type C4-dicarboxylate transport system substrate-binding protein
MYANKMFEVQKFLTITNHVYTPVALLASKKWWSTLTSEQQKSIEKVAVETRAFQRSQEIKDAGEVVSQLKAKGMSVNEMSAAELEKIRVAVQPVIDKNTETIGAAFSQSFYGELSKFRSAKR